MAAAALCGVVLARAECGAVAVAVAVTCVSAPPPGVKGAAGLLVRSSAPSAPSPSPPLPLSSSPVAAAAASVSPCERSSCSSPHAVLLPPSSDGDGSVNSADSHAPV